LGHPHYGDRKVHAVLVRQGLKVNAKTVHGLWKLHHLQQKPRRHHRKVRSGTGLPEKASKVNEVWALYLIFDQTVGGQTLKLLTLTDAYSKMLLCTWVSTRFPAQEVIEVLNQTFAEHGLPKKLRSDNGSEFVAGDLKVFLGLTGSQP
jgi:putative transposase